MTTCEFASPGERDGGHSCRRCLAQAATQHVTSPFNGKRSLSPRGPCGCYTAGVATGWGTATRANDGDAARKDRHNTAGRVGTSSRADQMRNVQPRLAGSTCRVSPAGSTEVAAGLRRLVSLAWAASGPPSRPEAGAAAEQRGAVWGSEQAQVSRRDKSGYELGGEGGGTSGLWAAENRALRRADGRRSQTGSSARPPTRSPAPWGQRLSRLLSAGPQ